MKLTNTLLAALLLSILGLSALQWHLQTPERELAKVQLKIAQKTLGRIAYREGYEEAQREVEKIYAGKSVDKFEEVQRKILRDGTEEQKREIAEIAEMRKKRLSQEE